MLGNGLGVANRKEEALSVEEAALSMKRRLGAPETRILTAQNNLACTYKLLGRLEESNRIVRDVYFGYLKLGGEEHENSLVAANNLADSLNALKHFEEARSLLRRTIPMARRVLGENDETTLRMRKIYGRALSEDPDATLDDLREAVATLEDTERVARRVLGGAHPLAAGIEDNLQGARAALHARETPSPPGSA